MSSHWCDCHGWTSCPAKTLSEPQYLKDMPTPEETKEKIQRLTAVEAIVADVKAELEGAMSRYASFNSAHEGHSVILEEYEELWDEIKVKQGKRDVANMRYEAVQLAAMAIRFIHDVCDKGDGQK